MINFLTQFTVLTPAQNFWPCFLERGEILHASILSIIWSLRTALPAHCASTVIKLEKEGFKNLCQAFFLKQKQNRMLLFVDKNVSNLQTWTTPKVLMPHGFPQIYGIMQDVCTCVWNIFLKYISETKESENAWPHKRLKPSESKKKNRKKPEKTQPQEKHSQKKENPASARLSLRAMKCGVHFVDQSFLGEQDFGGKALRFYDFLFLNAESFSDVHLVNGRQIIRFCSLSFCAIYLPEIFDTRKLLAGNPYRVNVTNKLINTCKRISWWLLLQVIAWPVQSLEKKGWVSIQET